MHRISCFNKGMAGKAGPMVANTTSKWLPLSLPSNISREIWAIRDRKERKAIKGNEQFK